MQDHKTKREHVMLGTTIEQERMIMGKISNFSELSKAKTITEIEQWEISHDYDYKGRELKKGGYIRVRAYDGRRYEMCLKKFITKPNGEIVTLENEFAIEKDTFAIFKSMAVTGTHKKRYKFPVGKDGLVWEVDVYMDDNGKMISWCKLDLENFPPTATLPDFPITLEKHFEVYMHNSTNGKMTDAQEAFKTLLFEKYYNTVNPNSIAPVASGDSSARAELDESAI